MYNNHYNVIINIIILSSCLIDLTQPALLPWHLYTSLMDINRRVKLHSIYKALLDYFQNTFMEKEKYLKSNLYVSLIIIKCH